MLAKQRNCDNLFDCAFCWVTSRQRGTCHRHRNAPHDTREHILLRGAASCRNGRRVIDVGYRDGKFDAHSNKEKKKKPENSIFNSKNQNENCLLGAVALTRSLHAQDGPAKIERNPLHLCHMNSNYICYFACQQSHYE